MPTLWIASLWLSLAAAGPASPGPTLAREDTMRTEVSEVLVRAPRVTLDEILDRIARGERHRDSLIVDQAFVATFRLARALKPGDEPELLQETVMQVYKKRPDKVRGEVIRLWRKKEEKKKNDDETVQVNFRSDMSEEIVNFAFRPEARRSFRYKILSRDLVGDHLIYRIRFEPKSLLDPSVPSGEVWVDTNDFVILRQEVSFERSPVPLILKGVDRMVIERQRVGEYWVLRRVLLRAQSTFTLPKLGKQFDFALQFDQYAINRGLADSLFTEKR
jgi:hypothetical protein